MAERGTKNSRADGSGLGTAGKACRRVSRPGLGSGEVRFRQRIRSNGPRRALEAWLSTCSGRPRRAQPQCRLCWRPVACGSSHRSRPTQKDLSSARSGCLTKAPALIWPADASTREAPPGIFGGEGKRGRFDHGARRLVPTVSGKGSSGRAASPNAVQPETRTVSDSFIMVLGRGWQGPSRKGHSLAEVRWPRLSSG